MLWILFLLFMLKIFDNIGFKIFTENFQNIELMVLFKFFVVFIGVLDIRNPGLDIGPTYARNLMSNVFSLNARAF